jgi:hypothetical protein
VFSESLFQETVVDPGPRELDSEDRDRECAFAMGFWSTKVIALVFKGDICRGEAEQSELSRVNDNDLFPRTFCAESVQMKISRKPFVTHWSTKGGITPLIRQMNMIDATNRKTSAQVALNYICATLYNHPNRSPTFKSAHLFLLRLWNKTNKNSIFRRLSVPCSPIVETRICHPKSLRWLNGVDNFEPHDTDILARCKSWWKSKRLNPPLSFLP